MLHHATNHARYRFPLIDVRRLYTPTSLPRGGHRRLQALVPDAAHQGQELGWRKLLGTPAKIYYKYEGTSLVGSHKPNTAVPQAWYNAVAGIKNVVTETGAGQWSSALSFASSLFGLNCEMHASPSPATEAGKRILAVAHPSSPGSLGIAISEAVEVAAMPGQRAQPRAPPPDRARWQDEPGVRGCQARRVTDAHQGRLCLRFDDMAVLTPLIKMHTLGHGYVPDPIHTGGLRYDGMVPLISHFYELMHFYELGFMDAVAIEQTECFEAALKFARTEGIIPALEQTHTITAAIREAMECKRTGEEKVILMAMCGATSATPGLSREQQPVIQEVARKD